MDNGLEFLERSAPLHRRDVQHVGARAEGGPVSLYAPETTGTHVHPLLGERRLSILAASDRDLVDTLTALPVQHTKQSVFPGDGDQPPPFALHVDAE